MDADRLGPISLAAAGVIVDWSATALFVGAGALVLATVAFGFGTGARHRLDLSTRSTTPVTASPTGGPA